MLDFPHFENEEFEIHMHHCEEISAIELHLLTDPDKVGDAIEENPKPNDLKFPFKTFYNILCKTLCPIIGAQNQGKIGGVLQNTLFAMSGEFFFDVEDLFIRILVDSAEEILAPKPYAPWI